LIPRREQRRSEGTDLPDRWRDALSALAVVLLGMAVFVVYCGPAVLDPGNIAWLDAGDRAMHTLGWMFYREAPWGIPPGESPNLGLELSNSIGLVDGLPLFAMPLKLLGPWLPQPFQYWGAWLLASFALQGLFAWLLARALGAGRLLALCAAGFALITPAFLFRVPMHLALSGHFVVLAGLWLYARRTPPPRWAWPLLAAVTAGIHAYLLAMVLALWAAAWLQRLLLRTLGAPAAALEAALVGGASFAVLWLGGFFGSGTIGSYGYGMYKLNLLWPFIDYDWSRLVPDLPHTRFDYEGLSFLGLGIFALLGLALLSGAMARLGAIASRRWWPLAAVLVGMMLFAITTDVTVAGTDLFKLPLPPELEALFSTFRSTGRFVWPLLYLVTVGAVVLVDRRFRAAIAVPVALAAFFAQAVDSEPAWRPFAATLPAPAPVWTTTFVSPLWDRAAAAGYTRLRAVPLEVGFGSDWKDPGYIAVTHRMATDLAYLGRIDDTALAALRAHEAEVLGTGAFEPHTLYLLDAPSALAAARHATSDDLLAQVDGRIVFARHGAALAAGLGLDNGMGLVP
jgi:hypothetical protein